MNLHNNLTRLSVFVGFTVFAAACGSKSNAPAPASTPAVSPGVTANSAGLSPSTGLPAAVSPGLPMEQPVDNSSLADANNNDGQNKPAVANSSTPSTGGQPPLTNGNGATPGGSPAGGNGGAVVQGGTVVQSTNNQAGPAPVSGNNPVSGGAVVQTGVTVTQPPAPQMFNIGKYYSFTLPQDLHVQEFASNWNVQGVQEFYMVHGDPTYIGNYSCTGSFDLAEIIPNAINQPYKYCNTTVPPDYVSWAAGQHIALNHLLAGANPGSRAWYSVDLNLYDTSLPYVHDVHSGISKFDALCGGQIVQATPFVPVMEGFWGYNINSVMLSCQIPVGIGGLTTFGSANVNAYVTTFYVSAASLPNMVCFTNGWGDANCGVTTNPYRNTSLLEVTVIQQIAGLTQMQANQQAQNIFRAGLRQTLPMVPQ